ncbi:hypothetical protein GQ53DRAFT_723854 [Thozetella sp. PMI_491]|nr:hypothetical protein GQ53DRAFT_723854 [Thozetella sp. PMI_491]
MSNEPLFYGASLGSSAIDSPRQGNKRSRWDTFCTIAPFLLLTLTTGLSLVLLVSDAQQWVVRSGMDSFIAANRASVQLVVQVIANGLGFFNMFVVCKLLNYRTRLRLSAKSMSLYTLQFWNALLSRQLTTRLPFHLLVPLLTFLGFAVVPSALWAGAITPVSIMIVETMPLQIPSYSNTTLMTADWQNRTGQPAVTNNMGLFTYSVGERFLGPLLQLAAGATTVDGSLPISQKLDHTGFNFVGRSYGVGIPAGLTDATLRANQRALSYRYQEPGYRATVSCIYNSSTLFHIDILVNNSDSKDVTRNLSLWAAQGYLPNSESDLSWARYPGWTTDNIMALTVAVNPERPRRMLGIASGINYLNLNATQCETIFTPTLFNVTVQLQGRNISVTPAEAENVPDMEPRGNLTFVANWQLLFIATDQTSLYSSIMGDSFEMSIESYKMAQTTAKGSPPPASEAALAGLTNSITAMMDGILGGFAGAQMMVANERKTVVAEADVTAVRFGRQSYIIAVAVINALIIFWCLIEALLTRFWARLDRFDYMEPADLLLGIAKGYETGEEKSIWTENLEDLRVVQQGSSLALRPNSAGTYPE